MQPHPVLGPGMCCCEGQTPLCTESVAQVRGQVRQPLKLFFLLPYELPWSMPPGPLLPTGPLPSLLPAPPPCRLCRSDRVTYLLKLKQDPMTAQQKASQAPLKWKMRSEHLTLVSTLHGLQSACLFPFSSLGLIPPTQEACPSCMVLLLRP